MNFEQAIIKLMEGCRVRRKGWCDSGTKLTVDIFGNVRELYADYIFYPTSKDEDSNDWEIC